LNASLPLDLKQGDIVAVPFPYVPKRAVTRRATDSLPPEVKEARPAVVVSGRKLRDESGKLFLAMITKASREALPGDLLIQDLQLAGLPFESRVRPSKIASLPSDAILKKLGSLSLSETEVVVARVRQYLVR
jgi:mRNA-degrading endonuclease toxin of MazEF toxin-antitoxin module